MRVANRWYGPLSGDQKFGAPLRLVIIRQPLPTELAWFENSENQPSSAMQPRFMRSMHNPSFSNLEPLKLR